MSKQVDTTKPLSAEDRKYLEQRGQWQMIAQIDREHGTASDEDADAATDRAGDAGNGGSEGSGPSDADPTSEEARETFETDEAWIESLKKDELIKAIKDRDAEADVKTSMKVPDLQAALLDVLAEEED